MEKHIGETGRPNRIAEICTALRRAILDQALYPGAKLPEDALGERFGVSRTIARHALGQLAAEGLVELRPNRGATVARPSLEDARDLFDLRVAQENVVVSRLSGRLSDGQIAALMAQVEAEEAARGSSDALAIRLATEFHILLAEMTGSTVLLRYVREVCLRCGLTLSLHGRPHSADCAINEHREIIEVLASGDGARAERLMTLHLHAVANRALVEQPTGNGMDLKDVLAPYLTSPPHRSGHDRR